MRNAEGGERSLDDIRFYLNGCGLVSRSKEGTFLFSHSGILTKIGVKFYHLINYGVKFGRKVRTQLNKAVS